MSIAYLNNAKETGDHIETLNTDIGNIQKIRMLTFRGIMTPRTLLMTTLYIGEKAKKQEATW